MYLVHSDPLFIHLSIWLNFPTPREAHASVRASLLHTGAAAVSASRAPRRHRHRSTPAAAATRRPAAPARRPARAPSACPAAMPLRRRADAAATAAAACGCGGDGCGGDGCGCGGGWLAEGGTAAGGDGDGGDGCGVGAIVRLEPSNTLHTRTPSGPRGPVMRAPPLMVD